MQNPRQPTIRHPRIHKRRIKSRIHLHPLIHPLLNYPIHFPNIQLPNQLRALRMLHTMIGPQPTLVFLLSILRIDDSSEIHKRFLARVIGGERDVRLGMPVFGCDLEGEGEGEEMVYDGNLGGG